MSVHVTPAAATSFLRAMLRIESLSGSEFALAAFLREAMTDLGLDAHVDAVGNAVGVRGEVRGEVRGDGHGDGPNQADRPREILLLGHMDTVPGKIDVRIDNGRLFGRGAVDAKGPLAAMIIAAASARLPQGVRVRVVGAVEEESASSRGARHIARGPRPDVCVIGEPSAWDGITLAYKGRLLVRARVETSSSHSAGPDATAAELGADLWQTIHAGAKAIKPDPGVQLPPGQLTTFASVQSRLRSFQTHSDGLHDAADLLMGFRLPPGVAPETLEAVCRRAADHVRDVGVRPDNPISLTLNFEGHEHAFVAPRDTPLVRAFSTAIRHLGGRPALRYKTGTSDMNVVGPAWNPDPGVATCPLIAYGPGDSRLDHTPDEHIPLDEFIRGINVLRHAIELVAAELAEREPK
ncbi:MAG: [LysW]-lysine hydrolase [Planctomycetota bacterium]|nr:[LysW]-lysine hydrolase [Planctomycetota bacterium]